MADSITQSFIDNLITFIADAETPESVTNEIVARIFDFLNKRYKELSTIPAKIDTEISERTAANQVSQNQIDTLNNAFNDVMYKVISNETVINTLLGANASQAIESFNEIIAFLDGIRDDARLSAFLSAIDEQRLDIDYLERKINPVIERTSEWPDGFIKTSDGTNPLDSVDFTPKIQSPYRHRIVRCREGDRFNLDFSGGTFLGRTWNFLSHDKKVISQSSEGAVKGCIVAPAGACYLVMNATISYGSFEYRSQEMRKSLKVLCFGNSFTEDSMGYVPMILKNIAPEVDVTIGIAYIGGCSLQQHLANLKSEAFNDGQTDYAPRLYTYHLSEDNGAWTTGYDKSAETILGDRKWDVVTFQQNGAQSYLEWAQVIWPYLKELFKLVARKTTTPVKCGWLLTQGAYGASDAGFEKYWRGTADNARKTAEATGCIIFPYGTAVQNLRKTDLRTLGDGSAHNLTVDNGHLQEGIGCYCAALTNALKILQLLGIEKTGITGDDTEISEAAIAGMNVPGCHLGTGIIGMTADNRYLAQLAATVAIANPYCLTDIITGEVVE